VPKITDENKPFLFLFEKILPGLFDGYGGVNFSNVDLVFKFYGVRGGDRIILFDKFLACLESIEEIRKVEAAKRKR